LRFLFFFDAGQAFLEGDPIDVKKFLSSTGAELRFIMPVLNVPFRLIFAYNPQRDGVLDNYLREQKAFQFRFAVGTTF
jgi:outer membrane protein insertion porin family